MKNKKIAVLGLGYVGLPLAVGLSSSYKVKGFDISSSRISQLKKGLDKTLEITKSKLPVHPLFGGRREATYFLAGAKKQGLAIDSPDRHPSPQPRDE